MTEFLAQLWGPVVLAIGLGMFLSRAHYARVYRDLEKESLAALVFAMVAITFGILQVTMHNVWGTLPEIIISVLGWGLLLKGFAFALIPAAGDRLGDWTANMKLIPIIGVLMIVVGGYLSWFAYLA